MGLNYAYMFPIRRYDKALRKAGRHSHNDVHHDNPLNRTESEADEGKMLQI